jgi:6-pyruvoyltetrahydropterin/6-carboxytetrahydropterin synthase
VSYRIVLEKENFKFSGSHFTILGPNRGERLHGHNYYVSVSITLPDVDPKLGIGVDFGEIKPLIREITAELDEFVLLPLDSPYLKIERGPKSIAAEFNGKRYEFPAEDVKLLPLVNVSSELLAKYVAEALAKRLRTLATWPKKSAQLSVGVQETRGQAVFCDIEA